MGIEWIQHKGKKIAYIKYLGLKPEAMLDLVREATKAIIAAKSDEILSLTDISDCFVTPEFMELSKQQSAISLPHTKKAAIVGVSGVKKVLLRTLNAFAAKPRVPFDTVEEAKDWLAE